MSRESNYIYFLIQEYKILFQNNGFTEIKLTIYDTANLGPFEFARGKHIAGQLRSRFQKEHEHIYLHASVASQVVGWFWRDSRLWPDNAGYRQGNYFFEGATIERLDRGIHGGTPELLRHFLSKPSEEWLIKEEK